MLIFKLFNSTAYLKRPLQIGNKSIILLFTLFFVLVNLFSWIPIVYAEGSRELVKDGGYRPYLLFGNNSGFGIAYQSTLKVFVKAGETVLLGSSVENSAQINGEVKDIIYRWPGSTPPLVSGNPGNGYFDVDGTTCGFISTIPQETAGPLPNSGGYTPCTFVAQEEGVYEIEFHAPDYLDASLVSNLPNSTLATAPFPTGTAQKTAISAWDITVRGTTGQEIPGRVYTNYLLFSTENSSDEINSQFFILSKVGHQYQIDLHGIQPIIFTLFANNKGFTDLSGQQLFQSVWLKNAPPGVDSIESGQIKFHKPGDPDDSENITHKIFLNTPADDLPSSANTPSGSTWLRSTSSDLPKVSNFKFTGSEGTPNQAGTTGPQGGQFSFNANRAGNYLLTIDANNNSDFGDDLDRVIIGTASVGTNLVAWNGLDEQGNTLPIGVHQVKLVLSTDEVHFPFFDVEKNPNGLIIERKTCSTGACDVVYYDDSDFTGGIKNLDGESSSGGAHVFIGSGDGFGNNLGIDTWTSITAEALLSPPLEIKKVNLEVTKTHLPDNLYPGSAVTYTIKVQSNNTVDFSDVTGIGVKDLIPGEIMGVTWTCEVNEPGSSCAQPNGTGNIDTTVDLKKGTTATFTVEGVISSSLACGDNIENTVTITTPSDVTNNPDGPTENAKDTITLTPDCNPPPQPPIANDDSASTEADTPITIPVLDNDTDDNNSLDKESVKVTTLPNNGTTQVIDGEIKYTPNPNFVGTDTFSYKVCDTNALCDLATVTINVTLSLPPVANNDTAFTEVNISVTIPILDNDTDDNNSLDVTRVTVTTPPHNGIAQPIDGKIKYIPNTHFSGTDTFIYEVCDIDSLCDSATVTVTITPPITIPSDPPPVAEDIVAPTTTNDKIISLPPLIARDNGTIVSYTITTLPHSDQGILYLGNPASDGIPVELGQNLTPDQEVGQLFFQPNPEFTGEASFTYIATDNVGGISNPALVTIPVQLPPPKDQPPIANDDKDSTQPDTPVTISILANDSDPDGELNPQSVTITILPSHGTATINHPEGTIIYLPQPGLTSDSDTFTYQVCDTGTLPQCDTATVTVTILTSPSPPPNIPPIAQNLLMPPTLNNTVVQLPSLLAQDRDGIVIAYTIATLPLSTQGILYLGDPTQDNSKLVMVGEELSPVQAGELFFQPESHFTGDASFTYTATDNDGAVSNSASVTIPIQAPSIKDIVANDDQKSTTPNIPVIIAVLDNDKGQLDRNRVQIISPPTKGKATVNPDGTLSYTPHPEFITGSDIFTYEVCDLEAPSQCDTAQVTVKISPPPIAQDIITPSIPNNVITAIPALAAESNSTIVSYTITTLPSSTQGTLYLSAHPTTPVHSGQVLTPTAAENLWFQPNPNWVGKVTFNYQATDAQNQVSAIATVIIPVILSSYYYVPPDKNKYYKPQFFGKIWSSGGKVGKQLSIDAPEYIQVTGYIQPSLIHQGQLADIIVNYHWTAYSGESTLTVPVTITSQQRLTATMELTLFEGYLIGLAGQFDISLGYRLNTGKLFSAPIVNLTVRPNRPPTALTLSPQTVLEYSPTDTLVGSFSTEDPDNHERFRYGLVENPGNYFKVVGDELRVSHSLTSQAIQPSYTIKLRSVDLNGDYIEQTWVITALSAEIPPQEIYLTHHRVLENSSGGTIVGRLWTQDPKPGHYSYKLLNQDAPFTITEDLLLIAPEAALDFETQPTYTLTVRSQKANTSYHLDQTFTIKLINQIDVTASPVSPHPNTPIALKLLPDVTHQGQRAEFMSVILWRPSANKETFMYRREGTRWVPWHGKLTNLLSGQAVMLTSQSEFTLVLDLPFDWNDGEVILLAGYQLSTGEIFYTVVPWQEQF